MTAEIPVTTASAPDTDPSPTGRGALRTKSRRRPARWVASAIVLYLAYVLGHFLATSPGMRWHVVGEYLFFGRIMEGVWTTVWLTLACTAIGIVLGTLVAIGQMSTNPIVSSISAAYVWFFRGTPVLVQLIFWFNLASLLPTIAISVPFGGPILFSSPTNDLITPVLAALLGLGLNEAAYMSEIVRAGILGVEHGQSEAATALGMPRLLLLRRIVLPQAMRLIIPPASNEVINLLKTTSLVSVIALSDLLYTAQSIYAQTFEVIPLLIVASIWYLVMVTVLTIGQRALETRFNRGGNRSAPQSAWTLLRRNIATTRRATL